MTARCMPAWVDAERTMAEKGERSAPPSTACVVHMVVSAHTVRREKAPRTSAARRSARGCRRHFHHHSTVSRVSPSLPGRAGRSGDRNRFSELPIRHPRSPSPPAVPLVHTASASSAASTAMTYCAAVRRTRGVSVSVPGAA